jgi:hypothetical protein
MAFFLPLGCPFWLPGVLGAEVDGSCNNSWRGRFAVWIYMAAKSSHVGVDVDGLAYLLQWPTFYNFQIRGQGLLQGDILSYHCSGRWHLLGDVKFPR